MHRKLVGAHAHDHLPIFDVVAGRRGIKSDLDIKPGTVKHPLDFSQVDSPGQAARPKDMEVVKPTT